MIDNLSYFACTSRWIIICTVASSFALSMPTLLGFIENLWVVDTLNFVRSQYLIVAVCVAGIFESESGGQVSIWFVGEGEYVFWSELHQIYNLNEF